MRASCLAFGLLLSALPAAAEAQTFTVEITGRGARAFVPALTQALTEEGFEPVEDSPSDLRVEGQVQGRGRRWSARVEIQVDGETGRVEGRGRSATQMASEMASEIRMLVPEAEAASGSAEPSSVEPSRANGEDEPEAQRQEAAPATEAASPRASAVELGVSIGLLGRAYGFRDDLFEALGRYQLEAWPFLAARARLDPLRFFTDEPWLAIGITGRVWGALGPTSGLTTDPERDLGTTLFAWSVGLAWDLPLHEVFSLQLGVAYGETVFSLEAPEAEGETSNATGAEFVPDVTYTEVRPSLRAGLHLPAGFTVHVGAAWLAALGTGRLDDADWFPRSTTMGIEMEADVVWRFDAWMGVRLYGSHARRWSALSPEPGDPRIAGGALDELTRGGAEFVLWLPGAP
ncbi:MAG: hypothetical protein AB8I08_19890 [Sandaracinaceae bacterium]